MVVQAEGPSGKDQLAACRLTLSERDFSDSPAIVRIKLGITLSPQERFAVIFFGHTESIANLPGAETHWQDTLASH